MVQIGFSTGCLYNNPLALEDKIRLYSSAGANAIELAFGTPSELFEFNLSPEISKDLEKYDFISVHAPWKKVEYANNSGANSIFQKLEKVCDELDVKGIVFHPKKISDYNFLNKQDLPTLIENYGWKEGKITPDYLEKLNDQYDFGFVLDLLHAWQDDPSLKIVEEFMDLIGNKISHLHVAGKIDWRHVPLSGAENEKQISNVLASEKLKNFPIILEGEMQNLDELKKEFNFVKNLLTF